MISKEAANVLRRIVTGRRKASLGAVRSAQDLLAKLKMPTQSISYARLPVSMIPAEHFQDKYTDIHSIPRTYENPFLFPATGIYRARIRPEMVAMNRHNPMLQKIIEDIHSGKHVDISIADIVLKITGKPYKRGTTNKKHFMPTDGSELMLFMPRELGPYPDLYDITRMPLSYFVSKKPAEYSQVMATVKPPFKYWIHMAPPRLQIFSSLPFLLGDNLISQGLGIVGLVPAHVYNPRSANLLLHELLHMATIDRMPREMQNKAFKLRVARYSPRYLGTKYSLDPILISRMGEYLGVLTLAIQKLIKLQPALFALFSPSKIQRFLKLGTPSIGPSAPNKHTGVPRNLHNLHNFIRHNPLFYGLYQPLGLRNLNMVDNIISQRFVPRDNDEPSFSGNFNFGNYRRGINNDAFNLRNKELRRNYDIMLKADNTADLEYLQLQVGLPRKMYSLLLNMW